MKLDDYISYLASIDQLDELLGMEKVEENEKCINCSSELVKIKETLLYCKNCGCTYEHNENDDNKRLTYKLSQLGI